MNINLYVNEIAAKYRKGVRSLRVLELHTGEILTNDKVWSCSSRNHHEFIPSIQIIRLFQFSIFMIFVSRRTKKSTDGVRAEEMNGQ